MSDHQGVGWSVHLPNHNKPNRTSIALAIASTLVVVLLIAAALFASLNPDPRAVVVADAPIAKDQARIEATAVAAREVKPADEAPDGEGERATKHYAPGPVIDAPDAPIAGPSPVTEAGSLTPAVRAEAQARAEAARAEATPVKTATVKRLPGANKHSMVRRHHRHHTVTVAAAEPWWGWMFPDDDAGKGKHKCAKRHRHAADTSCIHHRVQVATAERGATPQRDSTTTRPR